MGVVNVTPDSFSDGGSWLEPEAAVSHGLAMIAEGAALLDVGGESTRPGAQRPSTADELERVIPVVRALSAHGVVVSCLLYTSPSPRDGLLSRMPSSA